VNPYLQQVRPDGSVRPYSGYPDEVVDRLAATLYDGGIAFDEAVKKAVLFRGQLTLHVIRRYLVVVAGVLRDDPKLRFELCLGVSGVHYPAEAGFELHSVYPLMSITHNRRIHLEVAVPYVDPHVPSLFSVYPSIDLHERETSDLFGIVFDGNPSLTHIETPAGRRSHPGQRLSTDWDRDGLPGRRDTQLDEYRA
jgi:NADH-quinone oxidoreductase subunit C